MARLSRKLLSLFLRFIFSAFACATFSGRETPRRAISYQLLGFCRSLLAPICLRVTSQFPTAALITVNFILGLDPLPCRSISILTCPTIPVLGVSMLLRQHAPRHF